MLGNAVAYVDSGAVVAVIIWMLDLQLPRCNQSLSPLMLESRSGQGVQHYVIKIVSDLRQVGGFLWVLQFPPQIKLTTTI